MCMLARACSLAYPACNAYAPYCVVICDLSGFTKFFNIILQTARFSENVIEYKIHILNLSTSFVLNISHSKKDLV